MRAKKLEALKCGKLRIVFVSMCYSEKVAEKFISIGVEHIIAVDNDEKVKDVVALDFAEHFYAALFGGQTSVQCAFDRACQGKNFCL